MATPHPTPPTSNTSTGPTLLQPAVILGIGALVVLGYVAFCLSGFGIIHSDDPNSYVPALPIYAYFAALLLVLQYTISRVRDLPASIGLIGSAAFSLAYVAIYVFLDPVHRSFQLSTDPKTLDGLEAVIFAVFVYDAIIRYRTIAQQTRRAMASTTPLGTAPAPRRSHLFLTVEGPVALASDLGGIAFLALLLATVLRLLENPQAVASFLRTVASNLVVSRVTATLRLDPSAITAPFPPLDDATPIGNPHKLWAVDSTLALGAFFLATATFLVSIALIIYKNSGLGSTALHELGSALHSTIRQVYDSLRRVLIALAWFIPALSIALFSVQLNAHFADARAQGAQTTGDLFLPDRVSAGYLQTFGAIVVGGLAALFVIVAVFFAESDSGILHNTLRILRLSGLVALIGAPFVIYGLAALNAFLKFGLGMANLVTPFRAGDAGAISLVLVIVMLAGAGVYNRFVRSPGPGTTKPG